MSLACINNKLELGGGGDIAVKKQNVSRFLTVDDQFHLSPSRTFFRMILNRDRGDDTLTHSGPASLI